MNFPRYWAQGVDGGFRCWRWSDRSMEEAQSLAGAAVASLRARFPDNWPPPPGYGYADRPLREPVLREVRDAAGEVAAVISRNAYGCQILNAASAMFVDVDLPDQPEKKPGGLLASLFSSKTSAVASPLDAAIARAENWARNHPGWNWRAYRTRAGLRLLATHRTFSPSDPQCQEVFDAVGADFLYRRLCAVQECFRARLTPKPWRCGVSAPRSQWPFADPAAERLFQSWEAGYRTACQGKATCRRLRDLGSGEFHPSIEPLVTLHDEATMASFDLPLA